MDANEARDKAKETFNAGKEKVNEHIKGLAFRGIIEKKVSAETRAKFPVLDKVIPLTNYIVCAVAVMIVVAVVVNVVGGDSYSLSLAKKTYALVQTELTYSNATEVGFELGKLQIEVEKLTEKELKIYTNELKRLDGTGNILEVLEMLGFNIKREGAK